MCVCVCVMCACLCERDGKAERVIKWELVYTVCVCFKCEQVDFEEASAFFKWFCSLSASHFRL